MFKVTNHMISNHRRSVSFTDSIKLDRKSKDDHGAQSENSSPTISRESTPRSKESTPRSKESTPRENSPRKTLLKVVHKLTHKEETPPHKHPSIYPIFDEYGNELGEYHYEMFEHAINGNLRGLKEILDSGKYTETDKSTCSEAARKHNHPDAASFIESYH